MVMKTRTKPKMTLWRTWDFHTKRPNCPPIQENLKVEVLSILGMMWSCRKYTPKEYAKILGYTERDVVRILRAIYRSKQPAVLDALAGRFNLESITEVSDIHQRIFCKQCGKQLNKVPCCSCLIDTRLTKDTNKSRNVQELPDCNKPTDCLPGTLEKMKIMQQRQLNGFSVFCYGDAAKEKRWV